MKEKIDLVKKWTEKGENDLINAQNSINIKPKSPLDTVCFHAQQCAEKYLKAYLVYHNIEFEKIHDLRQLILLAAKTDNSFLNIIEEGKKLTQIMQIITLCYSGASPQTPFAKHQSHFLNKE